ncbi:interferon-induced helicase C domain-containing protein 1, partial [Mytilus galloprovincialis]
IRITGSSGDVEIIETLQDLKCVEGVSVTLQCLLTGPEHQAKWSKDGKEILFDKEVTRAHLCFLEKDVNVQAYKLIFPKIKQAERGTYTLQVGDQRCECFLDITERTPTLINLRQYQKELAELALTGKNTVICAGTNSGKTYIAFHIIEDHLIKHPEGKVVFINKTNVLLGQQYKRACSTFTTLHFQGKIKIWKADEDNSEDFEKEIENASLIFMTPKSLSNHLIETAAVKMSMDKFTLIILDECHHTHDKSVYNELMSFYRIAKYKENLHRLPQILGLTASPGTNKAKDEASAKDHLRKVMANLDVSELSVVKHNKEELLQYTSIPEKVAISSTTRTKDPLKDILFDAMEYVEHQLNSRIVSKFLTENLPDSKDLFETLSNPPKQRTDVRYIQWIAETKEIVEHINNDPKVRRLLHSCLRHLELYTECLEINSLLEIEQVRNVIIKGYEDESFYTLVANTDEERNLVLKLEDVVADIREIGRNIEGNPDILAVVERIESEYKELKEESRFIIFVKTRATAIALSERLPDYLRSTYLTGSHKSVEAGGCTQGEQIEVLEKFRNGDHLCIVSTSVGCEGLDVPQCNVMIRYRFSADEISSLQMRGRVRTREGREVIVGTQKEFETEMRNIEYQYLMGHAIEEISKLNIATAITIAEKHIYEMEELERRTARLKISQKTSGLFTVNCKYCGVVITDGGLMRHVNERMFFVCDNTMLARVDKRPIAKKKQKEFDGFKKQGKAYGIECNHNWGSIIIYKERAFVALSQDYIQIFDCKIQNAVSRVISREHHYAVLILLSAVALTPNHLKDGGLFNETLIENCEHLGGKLAELETSEENEFIKNELWTRNTGVSGYWIGGYDFYSDNDMEWASQPDQSMSFKDMEPGEPEGQWDQLCMMMWRVFPISFCSIGYWINGYNFYNDNEMESASQPYQTMSFSDINPGQPDGPTDQLYMLMWEGFDFRWGDYQCYNQLPFICEFMHP